jgi:DNA repair protein RadD
MKFSKRIKRIFKMITPRGKQHIGIEKIQALFLQGIRWILLYAPTGTGKTEIAFMMMLKTIARFHKTSILLDRRCLVDQTSARLERYGINHGVIMADHPKYNPDAMIQIASEDTLSRRGFEIIGKCKLVILDEAHHYKKATISYLKSQPKLFVIGLSASPFTDGLGNIYEEIVSFVTTHELVEEKLLAPVKVFVAKEIDMTGKQKVAGEWKDSDVEERALKIIGDAVESWESKTFEYFGGSEKTIVFSPGVNFSIELATKFQAKGYRFESISYKDNKPAFIEISHENGKIKRGKTLTRAELLIDEFNATNSDLIGLISVGILAKGFDSPHVKIGQDFRKLSKSFSLFVQMIGRIMRSCPGKDFALWIDHSGNFIRFKERYQDLYFNGCDSLDSQDKPAREKTQEEKKLHFCPWCDSLLFRDLKKCDNEKCDWEKIELPAEIVPAELIEMAIEKPKGKRQRDTDPDRQVLKVIGHTAKRKNGKFGAYYEVGFFFEGIKPQIDHRGNEIPTICLKPNPEQYKLFKQNLPTQIIVKFDHEKNEYKSLERVSDFIKKPQPLPPVLNDFKT